ncbi:hypothetical protein [Streptomyces sp. NPDC002666]
MPKLDGALSANGLGGSLVRANPRPEGSYVVPHRVDGVMGGRAAPPGTATPRRTRWTGSCWMLFELKGLDPTDERFDAKMSVLMENVRHHVEEEEKEWFPDVRKAMGRNRLTELGEQMEKAKKKAPGEPLAVPSANQ